ncbi:MAG TPA: cysteine desulfurase family protein [Acidimicrobiales bacterium]
MPLSPDPLTRHYLDHASTSPPRPEVVMSMVRWLEGPVAAADPGRVHTEGRITRAVVEDARERVASFFGTRPRQVVFTSGGTEAANAAVWGATRDRPGQPVLLAAVEHSCVRDSSKRLAPVVALAVDGTGRIDPGSVEDALGRCAATDGAPALVQCQSANHEVGTVQPVADVVELCRRHGARVHVDACALAGHLPLSFDELGADLLSVSAHKFGGPPGVGALLVRRGLRLDPLLVGGEQERARRAGLENVPAIVGFGAAAEALARSGALEAERDAARRRTTRLLEAATAVDGVDAVGDRDHRLPHLVCVTIDGVEAEPVLLGLDQRGIAAHSGSSCSSESLAPSPVLEAMGVDAERSLRLSVGWSSTDDDVTVFADAFADVVAGLRELRG